MYPREIEASVQMRLYTLSKRQFVLVFLSFFSVFAVVLAVGLFGPPVMASHSVNASALTQAKTQGLRHGQFVMRSPPVTVFNQQLWLTANVYLRPQGLSKARLIIPIAVGVKITGVSDGNRTRVIFNGLDSNRPRELRCAARACDELILFHLSYLSFIYYQVEIHFYHKMPLTPAGNRSNDDWAAEFTKANIKVEEVVFHFKTYNPSYTQLELWFRFIFLTMAFIATCLFAHSLRQHSMRDWSMEQKWMSILLPLLLLYNDPILPMTFLVDSWLPGAIDAIFQATFLAALLLFWLCIYHGVRVPERHFTSFYLPKLVVVGLIWISGLTLASWQVFNEQQDPTYNYRLDTGNFLAFKIVFFTIGAVYLLYFLFLFVRAYAELRNMAYFNVRLKFLTGLTCIVLIISVTITALRFGTGILEDNFIAGLSTHYKNSAEFLAFYGLLNLYLYTMAFVYSPSRLAAYESHFKDNPTVSMLNDSDEEVIYGSDYEEMPLNATRK